MALYGILYSFTLLYVNVLVAAGKTSQLLMIQVAWVATLVPAIVLTVPLWGLQGVAGAHVVTIGLVAVPAYVTAIVRATGVRVSSVLRIVLRPVVAAVLAAAGAWLTSHAFWMRTGWVW